MRKSVVAGLDLVEVLIVGTGVAILMAALFGVVSNSGEFKRACREAGGKPVWDGRQYQCLGAKL